MIAYDAQKLLEGFDLAILALVTKHSLLIENKEATTTRGGMR